MEDWQALQKEKKNIEVELNETQNALLFIKENNVALQKENENLANQIAVMKQVINEQLKNIEELTEMTSHV